MNKETCEICKKNEVTSLCDMPTGIIVRTIGRERGGGAEQITLTCDKKICRGCSVEINKGIHFCKECADYLRRRLDE